MAVISAIVGRGPEILAGLGVDPLLLTSEERASAHFTAETASGRVVRISLPRGTELRDGDVLLKEGDWAVVVRAAEEDLLWIKPAASPIEWWAACYQLGNLHRPARFAEDGVLTPYDPMAAQMLGGLDISVTRVRRPFVGRRFGSAGAHHQHGGATSEPAHEHAHGHGHGHDHDHHDHDQGHTHGHGHSHGAHRHEHDARRR